MVERISRGIAAPRSFNKQRLHLRDAACPKKMEAQDMEILRFL